MSDLTLPTLDELARMSVDFDFVYPESYTRFVRAAHVPNFVKARYSPGWFVRSKADLGVIPDKLLGDVLIPFFVHGDRQPVGETKASDFEIRGDLDIHCFDLRSDTPDEDLGVAVFAVHTTVYCWPNFLGWLAWAEGRSEG